MRYHVRGTLEGLLFGRRAGPERALDCKDGCRVSDHGNGVVVVVGWGSGAAVGHMQPLGVGAENQPQLVSSSRQ